MARRQKPHEPFFGKALGLCLGLLALTWGLPRLAAWAEARLFLPEPLDGWLHGLSWTARDPVGQFLAAGAMGLLAAMALAAAWAYFIPNFLRRRRRRRGPFDFSIGSLLRTQEAEDEEA